MNKSPLEASLQETWKSLSQKTNQCTQDCEEQIRNHPFPAVLTGVAAGYFLNLLPLRKFATLIIGILLALLPKALLLFVTMKLVSQWSVKPVVNSSKKGGQAKA